MNSARSRFIMLLFISCSLYSQIDDAYKNIQTLPFYMWGWLSQANLEKIPFLLKQSNAKVVVELGSWLGAFTSHMANNVNNDVKIYAVDVWVETPQCTEALQKSSEELAGFYADLCVSAK